MHGDDSMVCADVDALRGLHQAPGIGRTCPYPVEVEHAPADVAAKAGQATRFGMRSSTSTSPDFRQREAPGRQ